MTAPPRMPRRRPRGVTLLETMVTLAIVAVLATLALPSFGGMLARHRLKAAAEDLAMDLAELRFEAARRGMPLHLQLTTGKDWCYALATAPGCVCTVAQSCQLKTVHAPDYPGVSLVQGRSLLVEPVAVAGVNADSAVLQGHDGAQLRVGLSPLGRPKVCAPATPVPGYPGC